MNDVYELTWDSHFFGYLVGRIDLSVVDESYLDMILRKSKLAGYKLVYAFLPYSKILNDNFVNEHNGLLADVKVTYQYKIEDTDEEKMILEEYRGNANGLYSLAYASGAYSRFLMDRNFGKETFCRLYQKWIDNSVYGKLADKVFMYQEGGGIAGFVTLKFCESAGSIGLIAVDSNLRGRSIGTHLIDSCKKEAFNNKIHTLTVATQLSNNLACSFYEKNGFVISENMNIYHFWL